MAVPINYDGKRLVPASANRYERIGKEWMKQLGPFCLGCYMATAPESMVTYHKFVEETGWNSAAYKIFQQGILFDLNLRKQLGELNE